MSGYRVKSFHCKVQGWKTGYIHTELSHTHMCVLFEAKKWNSELIRHTTHYPEKISILQPFCQSILIAGHMCFMLYLGCR